MNETVTRIWMVCLLGTMSGFAQQGGTKPAIAVPQTAPALVNQPMAGPVGAPNVSPDYILGTDDAVVVTVWKDPTFSGPLVVRPDGKITIPLIGDVVAAGKKPLDLGNEIAEKLKKYINDPLVTVTVTGINSKRVFFIGEVQRPGPIALTPNMTILQAVSTAGGLTPYANAKHMYLLRGEQGKQQKIPFDYKKALQQGNQQGVTLMAGDTIVVP